MERPSENTQLLTWRYVLALSLLAALAGVNFLILRAEIRDGERTAAILHSSGRQRTLLHRIALMADQLVLSADSADRSRYRHELISAIDSLEEAHFGLMSADYAGRPGRWHASDSRDEVRQIYEDAPWLLDSEMRNYVLHLRALAKSQDGEMSDRNAHYKYVKKWATIERILGGLDALVDRYARRNAAKTRQLHQMAIWSLISTFSLLLLDGWFVFRPMVRQVHADVAQLSQLNASLEERVAARTAEAERRAGLLVVSEAALRESEALYRSLVDHLPMYVVRKDCAGRFQYANERYLQWLGRTLVEIVGRTDQDLYPAELAAKYRADDQRMLATCSVFHDVELHVGPAGSPMYVEVLKTPLCDAAGVVTGSQTVLWDVTERKEAERRALQAERLAAIGTMVAGVAHESRNALQQIQACSRLLSWELNGDDPRQALIVDLQKAQDRLHRLFDDLRGYVSPLTLEKRPCDLHAILQQTWNELIAIQECRDVELLLRNTDISTVCRADPLKIEQVIRNVLENALAAGRAPAMIEVEFHEVARRGNQCLRLVVRDNGPGLSSEQRARICEPFFTTKTQGTGLGMAISKQIVEAHGGVLEAGNSAQAGAEIAIVLPRADP